MSAYHDFMRKFAVTMNKMLKKHLWDMSVDEYCQFINKELQTKHDTKKGIHDVS